MKSLPIKELPPVATAYKNQILASLPKAEIERLRPLLSFMPLPVRTSLIRPDEESAYCYFLESGMASVVATMADGKTVETGIKGMEGVVGFAALLGAKTTPTHTFMQIGGNGFRIKTSALKKEYERPGALQSWINKYIHSFLVQTTQTAACNRLHEVSHRLARWLLMCHDRMEADEFVITQEFLGHMLGTPRTAVTMATGRLRKAGLIDSKRGWIKILDRKGLEKASCECYRIIHKTMTTRGFLSHK